jgi:hypothetical protein
VVDSRVPRVPLGKVGYCDHRNLALYSDVQNNFAATPDAVSRTWVRMLMLRSEALLVKRAALVSLDCGGRAHDYAAASVYADSSVRNRI